MHNAHTHIRYILQINISKLDTFAFNVIHDSDVHFVVITVSVTSSFCISSILWHPFNGLSSRTTLVSRYQKGKTSLDLNEARDYENLYSPNIHGRYRQDTDMYKRQKRTIIRNIHYNMAVARFLTTTLWLCCALYRKFLCLLTIVSATSDWPVYL